MAGVINRTDGASPIDDLSTVDGYTYCPHCWTICTWEEKGNMHITTEEEFENMSPECRQVMEQEIAIRKLVGKVNGISGVTQCVGACPDCDRPLVGVVVGGRPGEAQPGDIGMCVHCGSWLAVGDDMKLRWATEDEVDKVPEEIKELSNQVRDRIMGRRY